MNHMDREEGLSEVVGFILILGLMVAALSVYVVYEVPSQGRENEIQHMNDIKNRFVDYKISLDSLWINSVGYNNQGYSSGAQLYSVYGTTLGTSFNLGTGGGFYTSGTDIMPFFTPIPSAGTMEVDGTDGSIEILVDGVSVYSENLGSLGYISSNNYWIDQEYYYKMGGIFLRQDSGITIRVDPLITVYNVSKRAVVQITPVSLAGKQLIAGSGPLRIESRLRQEPQTMTSTDANSVTIRITSDSQDETSTWMRVFNETLSREGTSSWCTATPSGNTAILLVSGPGGDDDVTIDMYNADYTVTLQNVASVIQ